MTRPMYLEWPLYRWFRLVFLEVGASLALFYALAYVVITQDMRAAGAVIVPILATYIAISALLFNRARALPSGPSKTRSLYGAERAAQATAFTLFGILIGVVIFSLGAQFTRPVGRSAWSLLYLLPALFLQTGYFCFTLTLKVLAREYMYPLDARAIATRIRNAP